MDSINNDIIKMEFALVKYPKWNKHLRCILSSLIILSIISTLILGILSADYETFLMPFAYSGMICIVTMTITIFIAIFITGKHIDGKLIIDNETITINDKTQKLNDIDKIVIIRLGYKGEILNSSDSESEGISFLKIFSNRTIDEYAFQIKNQGQYHYLYHWSREINKNRPKERQIIFIETSISSSVRDIFCFLPRNDKSKR